MQQMDKLSDRVAKTAERVNSAVNILTMLQKKHAANEDQITMFMLRLAPIERANGQITELIENLLGLIDGGFSDTSIESLNEVSNSAAKILGDDFATEAVAAKDHQAQDHQAFAQATDPVPEMADNA